MRTAVRPETHPLYRLSEDAKRCPKCSVAAGALGLMTPLVSYFRCTRCGHGWQVPRGLSSGAAGIQAETARKERAWLPLDTLARIDATSDRNGRPLESVLGGTDERDWMASAPGEQSITVRFHQPQDVHRVRLVFVERERERTQELTLWGSSHRGETHREILRRQFTFSPRGATRCVEEAAVEVPAASRLELRIVPDIRGAGAYASLREFRIG